MQCTQNYVSYFSIKLNVRHINGMTPFDLAKKLENVRLSDTLDYG